MHLERIERALTQPVTRDELIAQSRIDADDVADQATFLDRLIAMATEHVEFVIGRSLLRQTWLLTLDAFPVSSPVIKLPRSPVAEVLSITYIAPSGVEQSLTASDWRLVSGGALVPRLTPQLGHVWPSVASAVGAVQITYRSGWETAADVPAPIRHAILMLAAHWFEHREAVSEVSSGDGMMPVPFAVESLLASHIVPWVA